MQTSWGVGKYMLQSEDSKSDSVPTALCAHLCFRIISLNAVFQIYYVSKFASFVYSTQLELGNS